MAVERDDKMYTQETVESLFNQKGELKSRNSDLQRSIDVSEEEKGMLKKHFVELERELMKLKRDYRYALVNNFDIEKGKLALEKRNGELFRMVRKMERQVNYYEQLLRAEREQFKRKEETLKDKYLQELQLEGKVCELNCGTCAIRWICKKKLQSENLVFSCCSQLRSILTAYAVENKYIEKEDLECDSFIHLLLKCKIVNLYDNKEYVYGDKTDDEKRQMIADVWDNLVHLGERVCILGTWDSNGEGHCGVCDLDAKPTNDRTIMYHDPQAPQGEQEKEMTKESFKDYVIHEEGLRLYIVDLVLLENIIESYKDVLHDTNEMSQDFPTCSLAR